MPMAKLDFWNNPIVVSGFRVQYRKGGIFLGTSVYLICLVAGGMLLWNYADPASWGPWTRNYFLGVLGVQIGLSAIFVVAGVSRTIRAEVNNRTLDFQRITSLSPRKLLVGYLLGAAPLAYLLPIATVPLTFYCLLLGVPGVSIFVLLLVYLNIASSTILLGMIAMVQPLEPGSKSVTGSFVAWGLLAYIMLGLAANSGAMLSSPWYAAAVGVLTPIPTAYGIFDGDPFQYSFNLFGVFIPYLFVTPTCQLFFAYLAFHTMERRLVSPLLPGFSKTRAYLVLLIVDLLTAAAIWEAPPLGLPIERRSTVFCIVHLFGALWLITCVTPRKECLESWIWRFRGRSTRIWDSLVGERSESRAALVVIAAMGVVALLGLVILPEAIREGWEGIAAQQATIVRVGLTTPLLILALGTLSQWLAFRDGRFSKSVAFQIIIPFVILSHVLGAYFQSDFVLSLTPTAHYADWLMGWPQHNVAPMLIAFGLAFALLWIALGRRLSAAARHVDRQLAGMGISAMKVEQS
jgi:hypothetical protein